MTQKNIIHHLDTSTTIHLFAPLPIFFLFFNKCSWENIVIFQREIENNSLCKIWGVSVLWVTWKGTEF